MGGDSNRHSVGANHLPFLVCKITLETQRITSAKNYTTNCKNY